jgi:hypothetical protein
MDVFVRDRASNETLRVSQGMSRRGANGKSEHPVISAGGRYVAFESTALDLLPLGDTLPARARDQAVPRIYVRDLQKETTELVSVGLGNPVTAPNGASTFPSISADGRLVAFRSTASNLATLAVPPYVLERVFVRDRSARTTWLASPTDPGQTDCGREGDTFRCWPGDQGPPALSADGRFVAFVASNKLKKIDLSGGPAVTLADTNFAVRGSWNKNDLILFSPSGASPIASVKASGGAVPTNVTTLDAAAGETRHSYPFFLPDGRHFLFLASKNNDPIGVYIGSLDSPDRTRLLDGASNVQYGSGHLLFLRGPTLMAQKFDANTLAVTGDVMLVAEQVSTMVGSRTGAFSVSENGVLAYQMQAAAQSNLFWFDRSGRQIARLGESADYGEVSLSPDGTRAASRPCSASPPRRGSPPARSATPHRCRPSGCPSRARSLGHRCLRGPC